MYWGFDTKNIDKKVRPQDDFYRYANGRWLAKTKIPPEESRWGSFTMLRVTTEHQLKKIVETTRLPLIKNLYSSASDLKARNKLGAKPLEPLRTMIRGISSTEELIKTLAYLHKVGVSGFWGMFVDQDSKDSTRYALHVWQGGLGMPERDYYLLDKPEQKRVRDAYVVHIKKLARLAGSSQQEAEKISRVVLNIETRLAHASMKKEDTRDPEKIYNKKSIRELKNLSPLDWTSYFKLTGVPPVRDLIVGQPEFFKAVSKIIKATTLEDLKTYLEWHLVNDSAGLLSGAFVKENFDFYAHVLAGAKKMKPLWRRALGVVNGTVGDELGKLYIKTHFPPGAKKVMDTLVTDLFDVYAERIKKLDWMSAPTKRKAMIKLRAMRRKIGFPKVWKGYKGLVIKPKDFYGNMRRASAYEHARELHKLGRPINREEWFMSPQTVNAYFAPNLNEIVFPAAILQWPFFDPHADAAVNYAAIGSVIGHEITHGFDDKGSMFDNKGNLKNWWSATDRKRFMNKAHIIATQANAHESAPGVHMSGQLTLGENIADLGGLSIGYDAYHRHLAKAGRTIIGGLSPEERFFLGFAQQERELSRPEFKKLAALTDPHAEASFRINGPLSNFEPFYRVFGVKKGDKLYRDPAKRAEIW